MSHNIIVEGGTSVRLPTAGKYVDRDIIITATGGASENLDEVISEQKTLISQIKSALAGKAAGGGGGGISADDIASCAIKGDINLTVETIQQGAFWGNGGITAINAPNVKVIEERGLQNCGDMVTLNAPELESIGTYALSYCYELNSMNFPKLKTVGTYAFYYCSGVQGDVVLPAVSTLPTQSCSRMSGITSIDLPVCTSITDQVFRYCSKLNTIILRSTTLCTLGNVNTFYNMPFASGQAGGKLYVPAALVDSYKAAAKWSTILGYATNEIRALEDYTVDGTITGALDASKI